MKRITLFSHYSTLRRFCQYTLVLLLAITPVILPKNASASTNDFYFEDFTADYYLENTESGNKMHVKEVLTAIFPDRNQNHGITRSIPYTNLDGKNLTIPSESALNLTVKRNGKSEPINKIEKDTSGGVYTAYIGSASEYVHGRQVYTLEYDFENVITEFDNLGANITGQKDATVAYQELYWDTNGTGWSQKFENLTARLHLSRDMAKGLLDKTSCYVGYYGAKGAGRCEISTSDETTFDSSAATAFDAFSTNDSGDMVITFSTENLNRRENLTFAVDFKPNTFTVPESPKIYTLVIATVIVAIICAIILALMVRYYLKKGKEKRNYYKGLFVTPQYTVPEAYHVAEAEQLSFRHTEKSHVATLLELAVNKKIQLIKGEPTKILKKETWKIKILDDPVTDSQKDLLKIINGGDSFKKGDIIDIKKHKATKSMATLGRSYLSDAIKVLKKIGLLESSSVGNAQRAGTIFVIAFALAWGLPIISMAGVFLAEFISEPTYGTLVGKYYLIPAIVIMLLGTLIAIIVLAATTSKYKKYTKKGLDAVNYLDGLYLYINMAEKDRLKFLQSVKGADTSAEGIVKLYEKLLPYASLFGVEDSWLKELGKYCEQANYDLDWYNGSTSDLTSAYLFSSIASSVNTSVSSGTSYYESSGSGGGSSFSSGGGGGGFSGGGGGGGGGGGW